MDFYNQIRCSEAANQLARFNANGYVCGEKQLFRFMLRCCETGLAKR